MSVELTEKDMGLGATAALEVPVEPSINDTLAAEAEREMRDGVMRRIQEAPDPDPLWPMGAVPRHLNAAQQADAVVQEKYGCTVDAWACKRCGSHLNKSISNPDYCDACLKLEANNTAMSRKVNSDWMAQSEASGLALFERQPEESDLEWLIWTKYRDHYPMKLPTWSELAEECHSSVGKVTAVAQKWSFKVRMQSWARYTDDSGAEERIKAIKEMNARQVKMATTLQDKLAAAIDNLDPALLRPGELVQLMKVSTELERRIVLATPEKVEGTAQDTSSKQKQLTKPEDLSEVIAILSKTGALPGNKLAVEQTTTTRLVAASEPAEEVPVDVII